jgi:hypothetical protein
MVLCLNYQRAQVPIYLPLGWSRGRSAGVGARMLHAAKDKK